VRESVALQGFLAGLWLQEVLRCKGFSVTARRGVDGRFRPAPGEVERAVAAHVGVLELDTFGVVLAALAVKLARQLDQESSSSVVSGLARELRATLVAAAGGGGEGGAGGRDDVGDDDWSAGVAASGVPSEVRDGAQP
jgi:hypothetical protein